MYQVFAERYHLQFDNESMADTEDDSDESEDAFEDVEIDQSSELHMKLVAAILVITAFINSLYPALQILFMIISSSQVQQ